MVSGIARIDGESDGPDSIRESPRLLPRWRSLLVAGAGAAAFAAICSTGALAGDEDQVGVLGPVLGPVVGGVVSAAGARADVPGGGAPRAGVDPGGARPAGPAPAAALPPAPAPVVAGRPASVSGPAGAQRPAAAATGAAQQVGLRRSVTVPGRQAGQPAAAGPIGGAPTGEQGSIAPVQAAAAAERAARRMNRGAAWAWASDVAPRDAAPLVDVAAAPDGGAVDGRVDARLLITPRGPAGPAADGGLVSASTVRDIVGPGAVGAPLVAALACLTVAAALAAARLRARRSE
jgi:hypothetical protein